MSANGKSTPPVDGDVKDTREVPTTAKRVVERSEYVLVTDPSGEVTEIPTNEDNSVFMSTLQATVSGATGLKFKNPKTGASRAVIVDPTGTKLLPPSDGWDDKSFLVITAAGSTPARSSETSVKRRKMGDADGDSDSDGDGRHGRKRLLESGPPPAAIERRPVDLIVLGVNYKTTDDAFKTYFDQFGTVVFAELKRSPEGTSKGFGFVQLATIEDQDKVLAVHQHMIDGRRCEVKIPDQRYENNQAAASGGFSTPSKPSSSHRAVSKIFVGRLTDKIDEGTLRDFFEKEAKHIYDQSSITDVFIPRPFRGFAFVTFSHPDVAERVCKLNNFVVDGTSVVVSLAVPRDEMMNAPSPPNNGGSFNEYGYSYGYGKGGAGYGGYPPSYQGGGGGGGSHRPPPDMYYNGQPVQGGYPPRGSPYDGGWMPSPISSPPQHMPPHRGSGGGNQWYRHGPRGN